MMKRLIVLLLAAAVAFEAGAQESVVRLGIVGLDTSHSTAFAKLLNEKDTGDRYVEKYEVVTAYPYGTTNIESASSRIPKFTEEIQKYGVKVASSIEEVIAESDCIFIETNDGHLHLEQAIPVFRSRKPVYIDKPIGATLGEALAIFAMAEKYGTSTFSSSAIRFASEAQKLASGAYGKVKGADIYSPHHSEPTHPDFGYYGIHGVEGLFTVMGTGCEEVTRVSSEEADVVVGKWNDGRIGTFRAIKTGPNLYGGTAITEKGAVQTGKYEGYKPLLYAVLEFFETGKPPVSKEETLEIFTFMKASNMSLEAGGRPVRMSDARKAGEEDSKRILNGTQLCMTVIDPGHFHASLLQKNRLEGVSDTVRVFAPAGKELDAYISAVESFNSREKNPTSWVLDIHDGKDWLKEIPAAGKGEFAVLAGNNARKTEYISECIRLGYNVLADKPMAVTEADYEKLAGAYGTAREKCLIICDIMTERYDVLNRITKSIMSDDELFGKVDGKIRIEDIHYFCKYVSGKPLIRPEWYFDVEQQGYGIADVTTHFIDLIFWECIPGRAIRREDVGKISASMFPTIITEREYRTVTGASEFPAFLHKYIRNGRLEVQSNGTLNFETCGIPVEIVVKWNYSPAKGASDSFRQVIPGTRSQIEIVQDKKTGYRRELYLRIPSESLAKAAENFLKAEYPATSLVHQRGNLYLVQIPDSERLPHEEHFNRVGEAFTSFIRNGDIPEWETENTLTKYYITTQAVETAR